MPFAVSTQQQRSSCCCCCRCDSWRPKCGECCRYFWAKIVECSLCKVCAKQKRVSEAQLNKTIVRTIATPVAIANIPSDYRIVKLL